MIENNEKGWYGCYSLAGRNSAGRYPTIVHKNEILASKNKRIITKDMFTPDEPNKYCFLEQDINVYQKYDTNANKEFVYEYNAKPRLKKKKKTDSRNINHITEYYLLKHDINRDALSEEKIVKGSNDNNKFKYHNRTELKIKQNHLNDKNVKEYRTSYNPKMNYIWGKTITGPEWSKSKGKQRTIFKLEPIDTKDYYQSGMPNTLSTRSLVNMNLQTQRGFFAGNSDVRIRSDKTFHPITKEDNAILNSKRDLKSSHTISTNTLNKSNIHNNSSTKLRKAKMKSPNANNGHLSITKTISSTPNLLLAKGMCFKKMLSREQVDKAKDIGRFNEKLDSLDPSYAFVRDRPITMVIYDKYKRKNNKKKINLRDKIRIDPSLFYDATETYNKIRRSPAANVPKFDLMSSRPINDDPLPSYMKRLFNRAAVNMTTDKTLMLNNYSEGQFLKQSSTFKQKKSYISPIQKQINLQQMIDQNHSLTSLLINKLSEE